MSTLDQMATPAQDPYSYYYKPGENQVGSSPQILAATGAMNDPSYQKIDLGQAQNYLNQNLSLADRAKSLNAQLLQAAYPSNYAVPTMAGQAVQPNGGYMFRIGGQQYSLTPQEAQSLISQGINPYLTDTNSLAGSPTAPQTAQQIMGYINQMTTPTVGGLTREQILSGQIPQSGMIANATNPLNNQSESNISVQQYQQQQQEAGQGFKPVTTQGGGTAYASPQQAQAIQQAAQFPQTNNTYDRFQQGFNNATNAGAKPPTDTNGAVDMMSQYLPSGGQNNQMANFVSSDPFLNSAISAYQQYMSQQNQQASLTDTYTKLLQSTGIQGIDTQLVNMKNIMDGTENDIRTEITKAGGFATNSQVMALTAARNKTLIQNYNALQATRDSKQHYLDTMMNLTEQDRKAASDQFDKTMNFDTKMSEMTQTMQKNAQSTLDNVAKAMGWDGIYNATQGNPQLQAQIEKTYGMPSGGLAQASQLAIKQRAEANKPIEVSPGATLYDPITGKAIYTAPNKTTGTGGVTDAGTIASLVAGVKSGAIKLSDISDKATKLAVEKSLGASGASGTDALVSTTKQSLSELQSMVDNNYGFSGFGGSVGLNALISPIPGTKAQAFVNKLKQVTQDVVLPNLTLLHGLGRVTDREFQSLQSAVTSLNRNLSPEDFKTELKNISDRINKLSDSSNQGAITQPDGTVWQQNSDGSYTRIK